MKLRVCNNVDCPTLIPAGTRGGRCPKHTAEHATQRGTTTQQGYGWRHQQRRRTLINAAIGTRCPDCGTLMTDPTQMVADHTTPLSTDPTSVADRVHCRTCSNKQGGQTK